MKSKQTYNKGDIVWVEEPVETGTSHKRLARVVSATLASVYPNRESHIAVRYLDKQGTEAYQCIPETRIIGRADAEQANDFQETYY